MINGWYNPLNKLLFTILKRAGGFKVLLPKKIILQKSFLEQKKRHLLSNNQ
jgi:hypothetical protein